MTAQARLLGGRYQVGELLGYGGMAEVHRGRDLRLGRDVAIKMLRTDLARDDTFQMRFRREAQNAASLNHPAIVAVYDTGEEIAPTGETLPFIVMEFVNGRTLKEVLAAEGRLMPRRALEITADVCAALEFSHRHGIIHRDIKPGNVMMTQTGQVKVMDFGIARALASGATTMTQTSAVIGTAQYLSPEQARGEAVDARSDVYAAGCVLFELLCGHPPFVGDSPVSVAYQHVREDPPSPSDLNPDVTPPIDAIVLKALSKNPLNRYQSAAEMRADLLRAAAGRPVMATPVLREDETMAMSHTATTRPIQTGGGRPMPPARVGDARRRKASAWVIATLSGLGVLAVIALVAALMLNNDDPGTTSTAEVPNVIGSTKEAAENTLRQAKLTPKLGAADTSDDCEVGEVTSQSRPPNSTVDQGTEVEIRVCAGPANVTIPANLVGGRFEAVEGQLKGLGLTVQRKDVNSTEPKGIVTKVDPDEGEKVAPRSTVTVEVSRGNVVEVPRVTGLQEDEARDRLREAGFEVRVVDGDPVPPAEAGEVTGQNPRGGEKKATGTTVTITVSVPEEDDEPTPPTPTPTPTTGNGGGGGLFPPVTRPESR
ncbi:Stk1 family PASTA domain-containing Ser/Thr kinase [Plantactinospora sp. KLBMP9567]|uniref:Stk1 family PASTA domain-containing Ser/Thr kinase n=1 Tax=Plantactinospora sp. KLBMP9567 TaxID=3085900 RepID=UPI002980B249|nr:Stk1 family PASTA domain-containing Ser/Thr kinase [Plantactinospora sp. KLBMP9567]MDW5327279.1 Stk1 family PASTA domain-containing Ser/Thr kinase [Plantactinospora sp. KLBMP9567]